MIRLISAILPLALVLPIQAAFSSQAPTGNPQSLENEFSISLTMFATLAAINAAGYDTGIDSPLNERFKVRTQIREELAKRKIGCLPELQQYYRLHRKADDTANLSQYLSFALVAKDAPVFDLPAEVPPDVEPLRGFSSLLARFYKEANLEDLWQRAQPAYAAAMSEYQEPVINALFETNGYLRNASGYLGRRFQIYLDLLGAPNQIQVRSYKDDYFIVITPTTDPAVNEIRDAYIAYVIDPLSFKYASIINDKKALAKYAQDAPALDLAYKDDFQLLVTKCLIKAIGTHLTHESSEQRQAQVTEAMREGFILTPAFFDLLGFYERQPDSFRLFYPDLIGMLDVRKEEKRLKNVQFVQSVPKRVVAPPAKMQIDPAEQTIDAAEGMFEQRDLESAESTFKKALQQTDNKSLKGRAFYGLGLIALQSKRWDEAQNLFQRTVEMSPDSQDAGWGHYYLGVLSLKQGDAKQAESEFHMALNTRELSAKAREAVEKAMQSNSGENKQ